MGLHYTALFSIRSSQLLSTANYRAESNFEMKSDTPKSPSKFTIRPGYFRRRDFEIVQPLYDLAFLLEVGALCMGCRATQISNFFSLESRIQSGTGCTSTVIDRWMDRGIE